MSDRAAILDALLDELADRIAARLEGRLAPPPAAAPELLTLREAAKLLRSSEGTLRRRILSGELESVRHGKRILVRASDVQALVARPTFEPLAPDDAEAGDEVERVLNRLRSAS